MKSLSRILSSATPWTAAYQAPLSMGFSRQEYWSGLPFPFQRMNVKSESEVAQSRLTLSDPIDCSLPGSSIHGIFQATVLEWGAIAFSWKQPRCPSADEWIRKLWYIYTMEYYSAIKKNSFESVLMRWMKLEPIIQSEVSQKEKHQYSVLTHIYGI